MKTHKRDAQLVAGWRKIIKKSQSQFAAMIGVSKHTVISVENGRNRLSPKLADRIYETTGVNLALDDIASKILAGNYTADKFNRWREMFFPSNEATARQQFDELKVWLKVVLLAAAKPGRAGNRDRLPGVCLSFGEWLDETRKNFKLDHEIRDALIDETREVSRRALMIPALLGNIPEAKQQLVEHEIDFTAIKKHLKKCGADDWLIVEDEWRLTWSSDHRTTILVENRKLIPSARCWIRTSEPGLPSGDELTHLLRPYEPGEVLLPLSKAAPKPA
jgi:DNA-binding XRE family transcriptional regulator